MIPGTTLESAIALSTTLSSRLLARAPEMLETMLVNIMLMMLMMTIIAVISGVIVFHMSCWLDLVPSTRRGMVCLLHDTSTYTTGKPFSPMSCCPTHVKRAGVVYVFLIDWTMRDEVT